MNVTEALKARTSIREFLDTPVSEAQVREILDVARWSPSGGNLQPWKVIVVAGEARQAVMDVARSALSESPTGEETDYPIYPSNLWEPYRSRRYVLGEAMYALLEIPREDKMARLMRFARNYEFFGAPVGSSSSWIGAWVTGSGRTSACSCNRSRSPPSSAAYRPACRKRGEPSVGRSAVTSGSPIRKSCTAAWPWDTRIPRTP